MRQAQTTVLKPSRRYVAGTAHDPAKLSAELRELALRAHKLVRAKDASRFEVSDDLDDQLTEVHGQIVELLRVLRASHLDRLASYVSALREGVEERLA